MGQLSEYSPEKLGWMGLGPTPENLPKSPSPPRYRVAWKSLLTGHLGHGSWLTDLLLAETWVDAMNAEHRDLMHWVESEGAWICPLCAEENTGEVCATQWCRLTPQQAEIVAGWIACVECGCGHPDITNGGERCPCCKEGEDPELAYWYALDDVRAGRLT